ncbi:MAG: M16 family metallopeptidase [Tepidisphaeraceae bacterium]
MFQPKTGLGYGAESYRLVNQEGEIVSVLKNGLTVVAKRVASPVVTVRGYVHTGGLYEGRWLGGGLSHLLEHLVAGGSTERRTEAENRELLQQIGNNSNAYTTYDHTAYFINTTPRHMGQAVDLLMGWLLGAKITPEEYRREYQVVQRELEKGKGEPGRQFYLLSARNRYTLHPARVPVIGYQEVIQGLSRDDVYEYYKLTYQPNNMVIAIAGDADPEVTLRAVQEQVTDAAPGRVFTRELPTEPEVTSPRTLVATFPKLGQAKLELAFPTIELSHPDLYALDLLAAVLSWGESSILTEEIRDTRQLVSGIGASSYTPHWGPGSFEVSMSLPPDNVGKATAAVLAEIEKVKKDGVIPERLERAKTQVRTSRVKSLQTSEQIAASLATDYMSTGDAHFSDRYTERMQQVTADQVRDAARRWLDTTKLLTTAMLPAEYVGAGGLPKAEDLIRPVAPTTAPAPSTPPASEVTRVELENGTILLLKRLTASPLVAVNMYTIGGLTAEDASTNGLGNLTMELVPRGTKTRSARQIAESFDSIGGDINAASGNNTWYWNASFLNTDFDKAMEVYADVINNASFPESELAPMKQRILAAIEGQDADWTNQAMRYFKQVYYSPENSPYQFQTIGTKENVTGFTLRQVRDWYANQVLKNRRVLAIYGDVDVEHAKKVASELLGKGPKLQGAALAPVAPPATQEAVAGTPAVDVARVVVQKTEQPVAGVVIGFDSDSVIGDPANFPLVVADTMTSGFTYPTGYLHEILRGRGLVYVVHAFNSPGRNKELPGAFVVYAGSDPRKVNEVVETILQNIARVQGTDADMQPGWFERSKRLVVTADAMDNETAAEQATTAALDELYGLGYDYHRHFADKVEAVTGDDVRHVARHRLRKAVVTVSTPAPDLVKVQPGVREYDDFPPVDLTPRGVQHDTGGAR